MMRSNPVTEARPRTVARGRTTRPETGQVVALLAAARQEGERAGLGLRLAAVTGARAGEIVALRFDDLSGDRLRIGRQRHSINGEALVREDRTKTGRQRTVLLDGSTVERIEAWRRHAEMVVGSPTEWMLSDPGASMPPSPRWLYEVFMRAATRAGVSVGRDRGLVLHDLRHWSARAALRDGHDPMAVAARLGHRPETLLRIYADEIDHGQADVAASLAARLDA
jgi:integrase